MTRFDVPDGERNEDDVRCAVFPDRKSDRSLKEADELGVGLHAETVGAAIAVKEARHFTRRITGLLVRRRASSRLLLL